MTRGDQYRASAEAAEAAAATAATPDLEREFLALAAQWRDLARQADEFDGALKRFETDLSSQGG